MGIASASFTIHIRDEDPLVLVEDLLRFLSKQFLQPKSMEIHLPGRRSEKVKGSIDGDLFWGKHELPSQFPGERLISGTEFTSLAEPDAWLTIPRDLPWILDCLQTYCEESAQLWRARQTTDDVFLAFWGLCFLAFDSTSNEGYALRQRLYGAQVLEPILRVTSHLTRFPRPEFMVRLFTRSFVWSHYTSSFDTATQAWVAKPQLQVEQANARLLAETLITFARRHPGAEAEWEHEQQHSPDLRGSLVSEIAARFGPVNTPQCVRNLETPNDGLVHKR